MDETRFDALARTLARTATRRRTLAGLLVGAIPAAVNLEEEVAASKRRKQHNGKAATHTAGHKDQHDAVDSEKKKKKKKKKPPTTQPPTTQPPTTQPPCPGGTTRCNGVCVDTTSDSQNCGQCGTTCPTQTTNQCVAGTCQCGSEAACAANETCCSGGESGTGACQTLGTDINNCGACGYVCPGANQTATSNVSCPGGSCSFSCKGPNYDLNADPANGCEREDTQTNRTQATAAYLGSKSCVDADSGGTFSAVIYTDARDHANPVPPGFNTVTGAAPLWYRVFAEGGLFCQNDPAVSLTMDAGGSNNCYKLVLITNKGTTERQVVDGQANIALPKDSYDDDTDVYIKIEKFCGPAFREVARFNVTYHL